MKIILRCLFTALIMLSLAGCGLKGPLYMPNDSKDESKNKNQVEQSSVKTADKSTAEVQ